MFKFMHVNFYFHFDPFSLNVICGRASEGNNNVKSEKEHRNLKSGEKGDEGDERIICLIQVFCTRSSPKTRRLNSDLHISMAIIIKGK